MSYNIKIKEVLEFVEENDVKILGIPKNISIMPQELERAFEQGISFFVFTS